MGRGRPIISRNATATTPLPTGAPALFGPGAAIDGRTAEGGWALTAADGENHRLVAETVLPVGAGEETTFTVVLHQNAGGGRTLGRFRMAATTDPGPVRTAPGPDVNKEILAIAATERAKRTDEQRERIAGFYRRVAPALAPARAAPRAAAPAQRGRLGAAPQSPVTAPHEPQPRAVLPRGTFLAAAAGARIP